MTIGLMLTFFDFRNDVRALIKSICLEHQVVVFIKPEHEQLIQKYMIPGMKCRIIDEYKATQKNNLYTKLYLLFKKLPQSKGNYYLMESFKAGGQIDARQQKKAARLLKYQRLLPHFMSYDSYLNKLAYSGKTDLTGIDKMIAFTEIYDDYLLARLIQEKHPTFVYVYSWDHACKHVRFSNRLQYLVWNKDIAHDVNELQGIHQQNIHELGATQFAYIEKFKSAQPTKQNTAPYFYYGCGIGITGLVEDEINLIALIADCIKQVYPDCKLLVRPYPNFKDWTLYNRLLEKSNIVLDNSYKQSDLSVTDEDIMEKFNKIEHAIAFFHIGTTLGLEACFTNTPSFIIDIARKSDEAVSLYNFIHQYQNEKYLIEHNPLNVISSKEQLLSTLANIQSRDYMNFNRKTAARFELKSFNKLAEDLINA